MQNKVLTSASIVFAGTLLSSVAFGENLTNQIQVGYERATVDLNIPSFNFEFESETKIFAVDYSYFVTGLNDSRGPRAEAIFVDRASDVSVSFARQDEDFEGSESEAKIVAIGGRYVHRDSGWLVGGGLTSTNQDERDSDDSTLTISVGKYLAELISLTLSYSTTNSDLDSGDSTIYELSYEQLVEFPNDSYLKIDGAVAIAQPDDRDDTNIAGVGVTYYPMSVLGLGIGYTTVDGDNFELSGYTLGVSYHPTSNFGLAFDYTDGDGEELDGLIEVESEVISLSATIRF